MELKDQVAIITGAARGIGRTTALLFAKNGAIVIPVDIVENELEGIAGIVGRQGGECLPMAADVSKLTDIENVVNQVMKKYGKIDILVNIAGILGPSEKMWEIEEEDWDRTFAINLKSVFLFCKLVVPKMVEKKDGRIVNVASIAAKEGNENLAAYSASKAGVVNLSRTLSKEVALFGVRVNSIAPTLIETDMVRKMPKEQMDFILKKIPMGRLGKTEEVAELILFLASDRSSFITGQCFNVTGGRGDY